MRNRRFIQCDVFSPLPTQGNGLAVVVDGDGLSDEQMQTFAAWTNLAETTFILAPG
ncbi:MAG: PhzF family phenazine biosynthesis protein, partial [bacterium]|nr:PhzF family phenazine biosynthesis protein [bacterium]